MTLLVRRVEQVAGAATPTPGLGGGIHPADGSHVITSQRPEILMTLQMTETIGTVTVAEIAGTQGETGGIVTEVQERGVVIIGLLRDYKRGATEAALTGRTRGDIQEAAGGRRRDDTAGDRGREITGVTMTEEGTRIEGGARRRRMTGDPTGAETGAEGTSRGSPGTGRMTPWTDTGELY